MSTPLWVSEMSTAFWDAAGGPEPFPRDLRQPLAWALPLSILSLPRLRLADALDWLAAHAPACRIATADRPLRACLVARRGAGLIFLDGTDPEDEQRFSLAHELAHFLRHYQEPRRRASERLGSAVFGILDGERPPDPGERIASILARVPLGIHVHLMGRGAQGDVSPASIDAAEQEADRLAFELLAPAEVVSRQTHGSSAEGVAHLLRNTYGLPAAPAARYATILRPPTPESIIRRWGLRRG